MSDRIEAARRRSARRALIRQRREAVALIASALRMPAQPYAIPRAHRRPVRPSMVGLDDPSTAE